ncbi:unnamed protein product, partial [Staurois parvus]
MIRCLLGHMTGPRRCWAIHKVQQRFSCMRRGHPAKREGQLRESGSGYLSNSVHCLQSLVIPCTVCSLWSFPVLSAVSGHPLHCLQSLVIPCTVCSLWSFPVL